MRWYWQISRTWGRRSRFGISLRLGPFKVIFWLRDRRRRT